LTILTCVSNVGTSFIVDGLHLKSLNQWYNKSVAKIKENKPQGFWSNRLVALTEKRKRQMRYAVNKAARIVINHCIDNNIGSIVVVVFTMGGERIRIISARKATKRECQQYESGI
jgi:putative transposase